MEGEMVYMAADPRNPRHFVKVSQETFLLNEILCTLKRIEAQLAQQLGDRTNASNPPPSD